MDITQLFKAYVRSVRLKTKSTTQQNVNDKNRILKSTTTNKNEFIVKSKDISYQITQLKKFLIENRSAYMKFACHLKRSTQMSDEERDIIDRESEKIINICKQLITQLKIETNKKNVTKQLEEHMENVLELLEMYLKNVFNIYNEQKNYRIQRDLETYKMLKLESEKKKYSTSSSASFASSKSENTITNNNKSSDDDDIDDDDDESDYDDKFMQSSSTEEATRNHKTTINNNRSDRQRNNTTSIKNKLSFDDEISNNQLMTEQEELSAEDIQMFESENVHLFNELRGLSEEVEQIEKNVVDIAKLQEIFTEKVTLQKHDIERIANTVVGTTENVKDANEQIKQAIQRNAGLRVYILFFLIVMSFSLLFLDWYND